jgi:glycosyltransferase involved in cell wall biosynthesis
LVRNGLAYAVLFQSAAEQSWPGDREREEAVAMLRGARAALFVSEGNRRLVSRQLVDDHPRSLIVRNPFRVEYDQVIPWPAAAPPWRIAIVGRLDPAAKGCDLVLETFARPQWRQRLVEVTFFGTGAAAKGVEALAARLNLNFVRFAGQVADVAEIWRSHHLLLLPSRFEGLPLAIIEAMLCGRPCVATDVAGNGELVVDGQTGFLAASATINAVAESMERAWATREDWSQMGAAAATAVRQLVPRNPAANFADLLMQLANKP